MLPLCRKTGIIKFFLICLVLTGVLSPFSAYPAQERHRSSHKSKYKLHAKKLYLHASKRHNKLRTAGSRGLKQRRAAVSTPANYADLVMDAKTGRILHATNPDELRHPASLTKMMTLYLAFEALKRGQLQLDQSLPVSQNASIQEPSKLGLRPGRTIRVEDALLGLVTKSANDATVVLAEALGGSEEQFARIMTNKARTLGMNHTIFRNPSGLPNPEQVTTARDMAILGYALIYHHPQFYPYFSRSAFTYAGVRHQNHNHLMSRYHGMDGIKTGYIRASGFNLVASAMRDSNRLIVVVFGGRSALARDNRMAQLMDQAFEKLRDKRLLQRVNSADNDTRGNATDYVAVPGRPSTLSPAQHVQADGTGNS